MARIGQSKLKDAREDTKMIPDDSFLLGGREVWEWGTGMGFPNFHLPHPTFKIFAARKQMI